MDWWQRLLDRLTHPKKRPQAVEAAEIALAKTLLAQEEALRRLRFLNEALVVLQRDAATRQGRNKHA